MNLEPKTIIVLGAIKHGINKFERIQKITQIKAEELNTILEKLESSKLIQVIEKKKVGQVIRLKLLSQMEDQQK